MLASAFSCIFFDFVKFRQIFIKIGPKNDEFSAKSQNFQNYTDKKSKCVENSEILSLQQCEGVQIF